ncbi:MAG: class II glutamine amidotransferase [Pseudomonadota bacterium]
MNTPATGLRAQARASREALQPVHPDGAGVVWYPPGCLRPRTYRTPTAAWRDPAFKHLASQARTRVGLAHVRAATRARRCRANCHPFVRGHEAFVHNGELTALDRLAPALKRRCGPAPLHARCTDSELIFCLLRRFDAARHPVSAFRHTVDLIAESAHALAANHRLRLSAAYTDGRRLVVVRYASDDRPPSLYVSRGPRGVAVASEPVRCGAGLWRALPVNTISVLTQTRCCTLPFTAG